MSNIVEIVDNIKNRLEQKALEETPPELIKITDNSTAVESKKKK
jgi:hypothetical protein